MAENPLSLPPPIIDTIRRLRRLLRSIAVFEGIGLLAIGLAAIFWLSLATDYWLEPERLVRIFLLGVISAALAAGAGRWVVWRLAARLEDARLALLMERHWPQLSDRLMTAVELTRQAHPFSQAMVSRAASEASRLLEGVRATDVIRRGHVFKCWLAALLLATSVLTFAWNQPIIAGTWLQRTVFLEEHRYPRQTLLRIEGVVGPVHKIARGRDYQLVATAFGVVPDSVTVHYRMLESGTRMRAYMTRIGGNQFRFSFGSLLESVELYVRGGDDRTGTLRLVTVDPPLVTSVRVRADFPEYTGLESRGIEVSSSPVPLPAGTNVVVVMRCNKPMESVRSMVGDVPLATRAAGEQTYQTEWSLAENAAIRVWLRDADGIESLEPFPIDLLAVADEPPKVEATLAGVGQAITPQARIPLRLRVQDDYGAERIEFELAVDSSEPRQSPIEVARPDPRNFEGEVAYDVAPLELQPGRRITLSVLAIDGDVRTGPHKGRSQPFVFEIVTPEELLSRIATRELNLRQRFEQIIREIGDARKSLADLRDQLANSSEKTVSLRRLHVERALQNVRKNANESASVASEFRDVLAELKNNRIGNPSLIDRLEQGIVLPLDRLVVGEFPANDAYLEQLRQSLSSDGLAESLGVCERSLDQLLDDCRLILGAMRKLETFNEVVATLRAIMADQDELQKKTAEERKKMILELLK